jgi:hypothetical protein
MQRIVNNFKWAMKRTSHIFLVSRMKTLPVFKNTAKKICWLLLCWLVERERGKEKGENLPIKRKNHSLKGIPPSLHKGS